MALRDESQQDSSTKKVLDYYEKYTQNTNLSKYFSGAGQCSPIIPIKENDQNTVKFTIATATPITTCSFGKLPFCSIKSIDNILDSSKTGEITSSNKTSLNITSYPPPTVHSRSDNPKVEWDDRDSPLDDKKLEWDSGADIGYHIVQSNEEKKPLRKCVSLPVLHNLRDVKLNIDTPDLTSALEPCLEQNDIKVFIESSTPESTSQGASLNKDLSENSTASGVTSNYINQAFSSNTASNSSCQISKAKLSSGCSSNSEELEEESKLLDFKMTLSYLKEKVGLPAAHSTPNIQPSPQHKDIDLEKNTVTSKCLKNKKQKDGYVPTTTQPLLPKKVLENESVSFGNTEQNDNISKQVTKMPNKRVIELTISKPISIEIVDKNRAAEEYVQDKNVPKLKPKVNQIENIFQLELRDNKKPPTENKHTSTFSFEHNTENTASNIIKNYSKTNSNYSSNCDSFEYFGNIADNKVSKQKEALQASKEKNNLSVLYDPSLSAPFKDFQHKETAPTSNSSSKSESKSISGSVSGDIEKHLDLLQKLLNSKKVHPSKKQYYIRRLTKNISAFKDLDSNESSGGFCLKGDGAGDNLKNDSAIPSKLQSIQSSSPDTVGKCVTSSSDGSSPNKKKNNNHLKNVADRRRDSDYLLQFAENERDYQINWIDHEISHLTKLKTVLELKNCKDFNKKRTKQTYVYKIRQNDGINKNSDREYVIQTKLDGATGKKIQYNLQGKKYSITDRKVPNTWNNSNENSVNADIEIHAEERQTNIKVRTSCRICNQEPCVCKSDIIGDRIDSNTDTLYDHSKSHTRDTAPKIGDAINPLFDMEHCNSSNGSSNLIEKSVKTSDHQQDFTEQTVFQEYDLPQHFNSLQKIFQKCCCTVENKVCNCLFVRNLFNRLLPNDNKRFPKDVIPSPRELKINVATTDNESHISPLNEGENRDRDVYSTPRANVRYANIGVQTSVDSLEKKKYLTKRQEQNINTEYDTRTEVSSSSNIQPKNINRFKDIRVQTSVTNLRYPKEQQNKNINESITKTGYNSCFLTNSNSNKQDSGTTTTEGVTETKELSTDCNCNKQQSRTTTTEAVTGTKELPTNCNKQPSGTTTTERVTETKKLSTDCNCNKQQSGTTTTEDLRGTKDLLTNCTCNKQQSQTTSREAVTGTKELPTNCNKQPSGTTTTERVTETKKLSTDCNCNKQQSGTTTTEDLRGTKDLLTNCTCNKQQSQTTSREAVAGTKELPTNCNKQPSGTTTTERVTETKKLSTDCNCNKQQSGTTTTEGVTETKESNSNQTKINNGVRDCCVGLLTKLEHGNRRQTQSSREELGSKTDGTKINLASNKDVSSQTSDQGQLEEKRDSAKVLGSGHLKEVTTQTSIQIKTKAEATSDETLTSCSCAGVKSSSISTSIFDSVSNPPEKCRKKRFVGEVSTMQKVACSRCDNQHKCLNCHWYGHCNYNVNCCTRKCKKSPAVSQGVAYNLIIQEPIANRSEKHVTSGGSEYFYMNKAKHGMSEYGKENGHKTQHMDPSKNDKHQIKNNYNDSQLELLKEKIQPQRTIREYLMINRPNFIYSAENRRQSVLNSRIFREHQKNGLKLQFLENNLYQFADKGSYKLFTEREMKAITKKNYKKLPEIQKKISDLREKRLRGADKLICDVFAKKVQKSALKGQWNFPIDKTVTNLQK